ncbi:MAG: ATP-binding cassette domain-containing protein, partial [Rhodospirillales bacterium]|nr:ATP-binding cassette domain-containing protein [Rhodospirillales bacterium]
MTILHIEGLHKSFGNVAAIEDLNFDVQSNTIHSIIGPNGAGKTTLFNLITGIYRPTRGRIMFDARDITGEPPHVLAS